MDCFPKVNVQLKSNKMCLQLYLAIVAICIQSVYPQNTVKLTSRTFITKDRCEKSFVLRCQSNEPVCCNVTGKLRLWQKGNDVIMNHGAEQSATNGKYTERIDNDEDYFELTIHNLHESDFGVEYSCKYSFADDKMMLEEDFQKCRCWDCVFICLGIGCCLVIPGCSTFICVLFKCCLVMFACLYAMGVPVVYSIIIIIVNLLPSIPIGYFECPCQENLDWISLITMSFAASLISTWIVCYLIFDWIYLYEIFSTKNSSEKIKICLCGYITGGMSFFLSSWYDRNWFKGTGSKDFPFKVYFKFGFEAVLECKDKDEKKEWAKKVGEGWKTIEPLEKKKYKVSAATASFQKMYYRLQVVGAKSDVEGIYKCAGDADKEYHFQLISKSHDDCPLKLWLYFGGLVMLTILIFPIPFLIIYYCCWEGDDTSCCKKGLRYAGIVMLAILILPIPFLIVYFCCLKGGNNRSKESGSSCWPPCSVGPDPNSPDPENARSLLKKNADKKNEKKPVAVVRSQPPKNRHVKTDNTESTRYSAETEIFDEGVHKSAKSRPLPSIGQPTISPRPLPQMPPSSQLEKGGIQLEPLGGSTSEKKKKKRRKKKESKQSGDED